MAVADVFKTIKENEVKFVDLRFTDTKGKEQHVTVPVKAFGEDKFKDGHAFDGSSIAGWKGIEASDMLLMPDPDSQRMDPFYDEPTVVLTCDVLEPLTGKGYERDPRTIAKKAEAYLKSTGLGDVAYFGPEPEFFIFDAVEWKIDMSGSFVKIYSEEAPWSSDLKLEGGNLGHRPPVKGGYFPVPPVDSQQDMRSAICLLPARGTAMNSPPRSTSSTSFSSVSNPCPAPTRLATIMSQFLDSSLRLAYSRRLVVSAANPISIRLPLRWPSSARMSMVGSRVRAEGAVVFLIFSVDGAEGRKSATAAHLITVVAPLRWAKTAWCISAAVPTGTMIAPAGGARLTGPVTSVTLAPRARAASASA